MYRKSVQAKRLEAKRKRCAAMRAARERKRLERVQAAICVGTVTFDGPMFGGRHEVRCLFSDGYSETKLMLEVDDRAYAPRTWRGVVKLIAKRLVRYGG
jgi:hypothetical protein